MDFKKLFYLLFTFIIPVALCLMILINTTGSLSNNIKYPSLVAIINLHVFEEELDVREVKTKVISFINKEKKEIFKIANEDDLIPNPVAQTEDGKFYSLSDNGEIQEYAIPKPLECKRVYPSHAKNKYIRKIHGTGTRQISKVGVVNEKGELLEEKSLNVPLYWTDVNYYPNGLIYIDGYECDYLNYSSCRDRHIELSVKGVPITSIKINDPNDSIYISRTGDHIAVSPYPSKYMSIIMYNVKGELMWEKTFDEYQGVIDHGFSHKDNYFYCSLKSLKDGKPDVDIHILDISNGKEIGTLEGRKGHISFSKNDRYLLYYFSPEHVVEAYDLNGFKVVWITAFNDEVIDMLVGSMSNNGKYAIVGAKEGKDTFTAFPTVYLIKDGRILWKKQFEELGGISFVNVSSYGDLFTFIVGAKSPRKKELYIYDNNGK